MSDRSERPPPDRPISEPSPWASAFRGLAADYPYSRSCYHPLGLSTEVRTEVSLRLRYSTPDGAFQNSLIRLADSNANRLGQMFARRSDDDGQGPTPSALSISLLGSQESHSYSRR